VSEDRQLTGHFPATETDLNPRQRRFLEEYLVDLNAKQAQSELGTRRALLRCKARAC
jgi:hypothetical protein